MRRAACVLLLLLLSMVSCQPPWSVDGVVLDGAKATVHASGAQVFDPLDGAKVEFRCPPGTQPTQMLWTSISNGGRFHFTGKGVSFRLS
jgi:hypothetical protein